MFRGLLPAPVVERPGIGMRPAGGRVCLREYGMPSPLPGIELELCLERFLPHGIMKAASWSAAAIAAPGPRCVLRGGRDKKL